MPLQSQGIWRRHSFLLPGRTVLYHSGQSAGKGMIFRCNFQNNPSSSSAEIESPTTASGDDTANNINANRPSHADFMFGQKTGIEFSKEVTDAYNKIVCYRQNLFKVPSGQAGKNFLREFTLLMSAWNSKSALADIAWTCIMTMPALLLQKPSKDL